MSSLKNKRLARQITNRDEQKPTLTAKERFSSFLTPLMDMERKRLIYYASILVFDLVGIIGIAFIPNALIRVFSTLFLLLSNIIACVIFTCFVRRKSITFVHTLTIFLSVLCVVTCIETTVSAFSTGRSSSINHQINDVKKSSALILSTDKADIYLNKDDMTVYTVSDTFGSKYINKSYASPADKSEYYFLYNVGVEIEHEADDLSDVFLYPPTPHTITGYDYLLEFVLNGIKYVSRVFIPGVVEFNNNISSRLIDISYGNTIDTIYRVDKVDEYLLFRSDYSSFSTPFENVQYAENEYFYVRYNRYMRAYLESDEVEEIENSNIRFINSVLVISPFIEKVNFFWVGEVVGETFVATTPVIEIVYTDQTSDIAIIKDINAGAIKAILGYN